MTLARLLVAMVMWTPMTFAPAAAQSGGPPDTPAKQAYVRYCSSCHGYSGKGDGAVAGWLTSKPADLTQLAKKAGGRFPTTKVMQAIDGTKSVRPHGESDMPIWGERFREEAAAPDASAHVRSKLLLITEYLESIQEK
jgi:mono/diheme cytochrome c family protein